MHNFTPIDVGVFLGPKCVKGVPFSILQKFTQSDVVALTVHMCTVFVALPFLILILSLYIIKTHFSHIFSLPSHWATPMPLSLSLPVSFLSSSSHLLSSSASYQLLLILITTRNNVIGLGGFAAPWGGWINLEVSLLTGFRAIFSKKVWVFLIEILGFFVLFFGFKQDSWEFL